MIIMIVNGLKKIFPAYTSYLLTDWRYEAGVLESLIAAQLSNKFPPFC
jgi:hypothetical protein